MGLCRQYVWSLITKNRTLLDFRVQANNYTPSSCYFLPCLWCRNFTFSRRLTFCRPDYGNYRISDGEWSVFTRNSYGDYFEWALSLSNRYRRTSDSQSSSDAAKYDNIHYKASVQLLWSGKINRRIQRVCFQRKAKKPHVTYHNSAWRCVFE